jgi:biopolymer transport protein ExbB
MHETYELLFVRGGPVVYLVLACSIAGVAVFIERMWALRRRHIVPHEFAERLLNLARNSRWPEAQAACHENNSSLARVVLSGFKYAGKPRDKIDAAMEAEGRREAARLERYISWLGLFATISPLLGLLGTVFGMIRMFQQVSIRGIGDHKFVAMGIWEALITTAAGLIVAIPAFVAYRYLMARVDNAVAALEEVSKEVSEFIPDDIVRQADSAGEKAPK